MCFCVSLHFAYHIVWCSIPQCLQFFVTICYKKVTGSCTCQEYTRIQLNALYLFCTITPAIVKTPGVSCLKIKLTVFLFWNRFFVFLWLVLQKKSPILKWFVYIKTFFCFEKQFSKKILLSLQRIVINYQKLFFFSFQIMVMLIVKDIDKTLSI